MNSLLAISLFIIASLGDPMLILLTIAQACYNSRRAPSRHCALVAVVVTAVISPTTQERNSTDLHSFYSVSLNSTVGEARVCIALSAQEPKILGVSPKASSHVLQP